MSGTYNFWLVALSLVVASLASYTALDLSGRIALLKRSRLRHLWFAGGAVAMGLGIWSMHFIGMLAFSLPMAMGYDLVITGYSLVIAIVVSWFALHVVTRAKLGIYRLVVGGISMGLGIASMHYTGMAAMQMQPAIEYEPGLFATSIAIAIAASGAALWIAHTLSVSDHYRVFIKRVIAACVMGIAICGMHYTGMAAARFPQGMVSGAASSIDSHWLATTVTLFTFAILAVTLILSRFDTRNSHLAGSVSQLNGQIVHMATFDTLTELPNRHTLTERIERAIEHSRRRHSLFAVLFMDIDGFKTINDSLGHTVGDEVLKSFARRLLYCVRNDDTVARLGGDEFVVVLENIASPDDASRMAKSVLERMRKGFWNDDQPLQVMPSIGIALFPQDGKSVDTLLKNADAAMYEAKHGKSTYCFYEASMNEKASRILTIHQALLEALNNGYFLLHFQPKFHSASGELSGAEALLRLDHPELGPLMPGEFIPIAERYGQIVQIGYWVVSETCRQIRRWQRDGRQAVRVAVNLSPRQLAEPDLVTKILAIVHAEGVDCDQLMFEITETVAMQNATRTIEMIREFQANGFEIAIDDFGTGYSSLAYLQRFRVKQLKIDRFFTNGLDTHAQEGSAIVSAIIALAHSLDMGVVAEGVETPSQRDKLKSLMCDEMQGYLLGRPLSADAFQALLQTLRERA
ncbi:putative bifunctional diguanylate cyclase/phosphodiesterase [Halomonas sp. M20]|uniref:putative bifunctional diguanylate cyclase/phosphodiesterase n=1 Tax=Halomonas sp. M20 TaxID=2763264 RepID=UPI001D0B791B|nr:EAL domain-containing protein [Halomonas sp. M20]